MPYAIELFLFAYPEMGFVGKPTIGGGAYSNAVLLDSQSSWE
jgi:hypothetical protein